MGNDNPVDEAIKNAESAGDDATETADEKKKRLKAESDKKYKDKKKAEADQKPKVEKAPKRQKGFPMTHDLKTSDKFFPAVWSGLKRFEIRKNDRDFQIRDKVLLKEVKGAKTEETGRIIIARIEYILADFEHIEKGYVGLSIKVQHKRNNSPKKK